MQLPKRIKESDHRSVQRRERARLHGEAVTKHQIPEPRPRGGERTPPPLPSPTLRPVTACQPPTEIKERGLKNHQLNERLHIQTGSNELMDTTNKKKRKI